MTDQFRPFKPGDDVFVYPAELDGKPAWAIQRAPKKTEVEPEWVVGQQVSGDDYARLPVGSVASVGGSGRVTRGPVGWAYNSGLPCNPSSTRTLTHLPDTTEPEDKADLYVEPEPLKAGEDVLVWARVVDAKPDGDGEVAVFLHRADGYDPQYATTYTLPDAIVRPDAGQVPPWAKPARCTSLDNGHGGDMLHRCDQNQGHDGDHTAHYGAGRSWTTAEEYGRVEVSS